jgi:hypothetical protein
MTSFCYKPLGMETEVAVKQCHPYHDNSDFILLQTIRDKDGFKLYCNVTKILTIIPSFLLQYNAYYFMPTMPVFCSQEIDLCFISIRGYSDKKNGLIIYLSKIEGFSRRT